MKYDEALEGLAPRRVHAALRGAAPDLRPRGGVPDAGVQAAARASAQGARVASTPAAKKIQLSRVQEQRSYFDELERKKRLEVEAIGDVLGTHSTDNPALL